LGALSGSRGAALDGFDALLWQLPQILIFWHDMPEPGIIDIEETKTREDLSVPWNVIVYNDPINLMSYVAMVFQRVFGYPREKAERLMLEVHRQGRSLVWSGGHEQAEFYVHQLQSYQLLAQMEKSSA
jgi:ATP-dependent Clp protease adaptor protein ClpS